MVRQTHTICLLDLRKKENLRENKKTSKGIYEDRMVLMRSSYIVSVKHEDVKLADWIHKNCDLTCKRVDI